MYKSVCGFTKSSFAQLNTDKQVNMKLILVLAFVAAAVALPVDQTIELVSEGYEINPDGQYRWGYKQSDGNNQEQTGELRTVTDEDNKQRSVIVQTGSFYLPGPDGKLHLVTYYADENGSHFESDLLPVPPSPNASQ